MSRAVRALLGGFCLGYFLTGCGQVKEGPEQPMSPEVKEAQLLEQKDPDKASDVYKHAIASGGHSQEQQFDLFEKYGDFLHRNSRLKQAEALYKQACDYCAEQKQEVWGAYFLERRAAAQHDLYMQGELSKPDLGLITQAIKWRPEADGNPTHFGAMENLTEGRLLADGGDYKNAQTKLSKAHERFKKLNDNAWALEATNAMINATVQQGNFAEANKSLLQAIKNEPTNRWPLQNNFLDICRKQQLRTSGVVPNIREALNASNFDKLEQIAGEYRKSQAMLASGRLYIDAFYADIDNLSPSQSETEWQERIAQLKNWVKDKPTSPTPKIALGLVLKSFAWKAQGTGLIKPESDSHKLMQERLKEARATFESVHDKPAEWYGPMVFVAIGQAWSADEFDKMVRECQQRYPKYDTVLLNKAYWLQPRWYGKAGDAEAFIEAEAKKRSPEEGNILYARATWWLDRILGGVFSQTKFQYLRAKDGMLAIRKRFSGDPTVCSALTIMALQAGDQRTADKAFDR